MRQGPENDGVAVIELPVGSPLARMDIMYRGLRGAGGNARKRRRWRRRCQGAINKAIAAMVLT